MVQLKGPLEIDIFPKASLFQYHYGSIKRGAKIDDIDFYYQFQYHYGSIKSVNVNPL